MKIVFMGTPEFAVPSLAALCEAGHEVQLVITQPDKKGNRNKIIPSAVKTYALEHGLEIAQPSRLRKEEELIKKIEELSPDMIVVAAFGQILPKSVLDIPRLGCINVHGSLLPLLRGAAPMQMSIKEGFRETGVTIMKMEEGLDTGDMIARTSCEIGRMNITELAARLAYDGAKLLVETIPHIEDGTAVYEKQDDSLSTYAHMIKKEDGYTDFNESAESVDCKIRAYYEWPTLYSYIDGLQVKFFKAEPLMNEKPDGEPGTISMIEKNSYVVNCSEGKIRIFEQQLQGKKRMSAGDFMRGHKLEKGMSFGRVE